VETAPLAVAWERKTPRNDRSLRWRRFIYRADSSGVIDWNAREGSMRALPVLESRRRSLARRVPHLLLLEAAGSPERLEARGERAWHGRPHDLVAVNFPGPGSLLLWFGRSPSVLHRAEYLTDLPGRGDVTVAWEWQDWKPDPTLGYVPRGHRILIDGQVYQEVRYARYLADTPAADSLLRIPAALMASSAASRSAVRPLTGEAPLQALGEVAPGVHIASVSGFVVMFVEFRDFVVAVEAPELHPGFESIPATRYGTRVTALFLDQIKARIPSKPVRYAIVSHHHSDHLGGLRSFAAAGATLIVAPGDRETVRRELDAPRSVAPDGWAGRSADAVIETVRTRRVISDGERNLAIINVGRNPHTDENLFVWLPAERLLFEGDLFYYDEGEPFPPSGRNTMNRFFARWLQGHGIRPGAIYGVHNEGAAGPERLREALSQ
jgi:glyoxylase-like metal-dependent hydrolase (beta-lactamase superfamily II)